MVTTNYAKSGLALCMVASGTRPQWLSIGSGSGVPTAAVGSMFAEVGSVRQFYTSYDMTVANQITWTFDKDAITMSGTILRELGFAAGSVSGVQNNWVLVNFPPVTFDGTIELTVDVKFQTF